MTSKIKNIIILVVVAVILILIYIFFIKQSPEEGNLSSSSVNVSQDTTTTDTSDQNSLIARNFLSLLLSVKSIRLDDVIFSDVAFVTLHDSSILLTPSQDEGRPNPFAPIGAETVAAPKTPATPVTPPATPDETP